MNTNLTIEEFIRQHNEVEAKLIDVDIQNASPADYDLLKQAAEDKQFLTQVEKGLELCTGGTLPISYQNGKDNVESLIQKSDYIELMHALTGGQNEGFMELVTQTKPEKADDIRQNIQDVMEFTEIRDEVNAQNSELTVQDVMVSASKADDIIQRRQLDMESVFESAREQVCLLHNAGRNDLLTKEEAVREKSEATLEQMAQKLHDGGWKASDKDEIADYFHLNEKDAEKLTALMEQIERDEPAEVIESSDGYVMNTSKVTAGNEAQIASKLEAGSPGEVKQAIVQETTTDPSAVGGKVKLEEAADKGTRERSVDLDK